MAIYRLEAKIISRSGARSSVAASAYQTGKCSTSAAAYRAGEKLKDERTGQSYDYSKKGGVLGAEIMTPAKAPFSGGYADPPRRSRRPPAGDMNALPPENIRPYPRPPLVERSNLIAKSAAPSPRDHPS